VHAPLGPWYRSSTTVPYMRRSATRQDATWTAEDHLQLTVAPVPGPS
jgi:hypothetical protein